MGRPHATTPTRSRPVRPRSAGTGLRPLAPPQPARHRPKASTRGHATTKVSKTKIPAYRSARRTNGALEAWGVGYQSNDPGVRASAEVVVERKVERSSRVTAPLRTGSPVARSTGNGSPVSADSSSTAVELSTRPLTGTTSPGSTHPEIARVTSSSAGCSGADHPCIGEPHEGLVEQTGEASYAPDRPPGLQACVRWPASP